VIDPTSWVVGLGVAVSVEIIVLAVGEPLSWAGVGLGPFEKRLQPARSKLRAARAPASRSVGVRGLAIDAELYGPPGVLPAPARWDRPCRPDPPEAREAKLASRARMAGRKRG
jgi:hypothetical protein